MDQHDFERKLTDLAGAVQGIDPNAAAESAAPLLEQARARYEMLRKTAQALQESLDSLRVSVKYLVFDLEATRRENAELRETVAKLRGGDAKG